MLFVIASSVENYVCTLSKLDVFAVKFFFGDTGGNGLIFAENLSSNIYFLLFDHQKFINEFEGRIDKSSFLGMALWVWIGLGAIVIIGLLGWLSAWKFRKNSKRSQKKKPLSINSNVGENTKVDSIGFQNLANQPESVVVRLNDKAGDTNLEMIGISKSTDADSVSQCSSMYNQDKALSSHSGEEGSSGSVRKHPARGIGIASPLIGLPGLPHHGWGHWFTLRDLQKATNNFSADNVIGEGGYGTVYHGVLANCAEVAVKKLFNNQLV